MNTGDLLLSCFRTPPAPCRRQAGLKGRSTALRFITNGYYCHASAHPQTPCRRQAGLKGRSTALRVMPLVIIIVLLPHTPRPHGLQFNFKILISTITVKGINQISSRFLKMMTSSFCLNSILN